MVKSFNIQKLSYDIQNIIGYFLNIKSKCRLSIVIDKITDLKFITNIKIVDINEGSYLTDKILLQPIFSKLKVLNI
jgi:hypothetical protein